MHQSNDEDRSAEREESLRKLFHEHFRQEVPFETSESIDTLQSQFHEHFRQEVPFETSESILKAGRTAMRRRRRPTPKVLWLAAAVILLVIGSVLYRVAYLDNGKAVTSDRSPFTQTAVDTRPSQMVALDQLRNHLARTRKPSGHRVTSMTRYSSPLRKYRY